MCSIINCRCSIDGTVFISNGNKLTAMSSLLFFQLLPTLIRLSEGNSYAQTAIRFDNVERNDLIPDCTFTPILRFDRSVECLHHRAVKILDQKQMRQQDKTMRKQAFHSIRLGAV